MFSDAHIKLLLKAVGVATILLQGTLYKALLSKAGSPVWETTGTEESPGLNLSLIPQNYSKPRLYSYLCDQPV